MFPIPIPIPITSPDMASRVDRLENALTLTLGLLHTLLDRLEAKLGPNFLSEELAQFATAGQPDANHQIAQIDALLQQKQLPKAVRLVRELTEVNWDEANAIVNSWTSLSQKHKQRSIKLAHWIKVLEATE